MFYIFLFWFVVFVVVWFECFILGKTGNGWKVLKFFKVSESQQPAAAMKEHCLRLPLCHHPSDRQPWPTMANHQRRQRSPAVVRNLGSSRNRDHSPSTAAQHPGHQQRENENDVILKIVTEQSLFFRLSF